MINNLTITFQEVFRRPSTKTVFSVFVVTGDDEEIDKYKKYMGQHLRTNSLNQPLYYVPAGFVFEKGIGEKAILNSQMVKSEKGNMIEWLIPEPIEASL